MEKIHHEMAEALEVLQKTMILQSFKTADFFS